MATFHIEALDLRNHSEDRTIFGQAGGIRAIINAAREFKVEVLLLTATLIGTTWVVRNDRLTEDQDIVFGHDPECDEPVYDEQEACPGEPVPACFDEPAPYGHQQAHSMSIAVALRQYNMGDLLDDREKNLARKWGWLS